MNGVKIGKVGKWENYSIDEEMRSQSGETLCKPIVKGLARRDKKNTRCWQMWKKKIKT